MPDLSQSTFFGKESEQKLIELCFKLKKNLLLEGPVGVGKTHLVVATCKKLKLPWIRIDGDFRFTESKLVGWFEPELVLKTGFKKENFIDGPLLRAMKEGAILFINELNRLPEGVQNILLPVLDERKIQLPYLEEIKAHPNFCVIATQNPKEYVATSLLSEAVLDRFEWMKLSYPKKEEEASILDPTQAQKSLVKKVLDLVHWTRVDPRFRRGASVRASKSLFELALEFVQEGSNEDAALKSAAEISLPTRVEWDAQMEQETFLDEYFKKDQSELEKKK